MSQKSHPPLRDHPPDLQAHESLACLYLHMETERNMNVAFLFLGF